MRALLLVPALLAFALLPLVPLVGADSHGDCGPDGIIGQTIPHQQTYDWGWGYLDQRDWPLHDDDWWYFESNGESGLQRGGSSVIIPNDNEVCYDDSPNGPDDLMCSCSWP